MKSSYEFKSAFLPKFENEINKMNKKAIKLGLTPITFEVVQRCWKKLEQGDSYYYEYVTVDVESYEIKVPGWTFIAKREHIGDEAIVNVISKDTKINPEWHIIPSICEHCNSNRKRKVTYIIQNDETQEYKIIGSSCLKDFLGHKNINTIVAFLDFVPNINDEGCGGEPYHNVRDVLALSSTFIKNFGWMPNSGDISTCDVVRSFLFFDYKRFNSLTGKNINDFLEISEEDYEVADNVLEWINSSTTEGYMTNLRILCKNEYFANSKLALLVSSVASYNNTEIRKTRQQLLKESSVFYGNIGQRVKNLDVECIETKCIGDNDFGYRYIVTFKHENNVFIWFKTVPNNINDIIPPKQKNFNISFTIKNHNEYNELKQTIVTRVTIN